MIEYARHDGKLSASVTTGGTYREQLEVIVCSGKAPPHVLSELEGPGLPESLQYLWSCYVSLRMGMGESMTWETLDAWSRHTGSCLEPSEAEALFAVNGAWLTGLREK